MPGGTWNRRRFLRTSGQTGIAAVALAAAGYAGYRWPHSGDGSGGGQATGAPHPADIEHFHSRPDLHPPRLTARTRRGRRLEVPQQPDYLFLAPKGYPKKGPGQQGPLIVDWRGRPVWFLPMPGDDSVPMNFRVQTYQGKPVLTWWQGTVHIGFGVGDGVIYDTNYRKIATVRAGNGLQADLHEFLLTPQGTALITAYHPARADTSPLGGPRDGWVHVGVAQEVDIATGEVLFQWDSLDHTTVDECHKGAPGDGTKDNPLDYFHINCIDVAPDGDLLVSARNTWTLYKISRSTGEVVWRMGGKRSDFHFDRDAHFYWQHDSRMYAPNRISLFDNASNPPHEKQSRGLVLDVDTTAKRVSVLRQYHHPAGLLADNQGSMQLLPGGRALVGWGAEPYVSEFDRDGTLLFDARFPASDQSYRAWACDWVGQPTDTPTLVVGPNAARGVTVYVSWNGATEVKSWRVLAGRTQSSLAPAATVAHRGFETTVAISSDGPYFVTVALDKHGKELGRSKPVRANS